MTGFRLGYACGPAELIEAMMKVHQYTMLCASSLAQKAAIEALTRPDIDVGEMVDEYRRRRNYIASAFAEMGLECHRPLGAFYAFPSVAKLQDARERFCAEIPALMKKSRSFPAPPSATVAKALSAAPTPPAWRTSRKQWCVWGDSSGSYDRWSADFRMESSLTINTVSFRFNLDCLRRFGIVPLGSNNSR